MLAAVASIQVLGLFCYVCRRAHSNLLQRRNSTSTASRILQKRKVSAYTYSQLIVYCLSIALLSNVPPCTRYIGRLCLHLHTIMPILHIQAYTTSRADRREPGRRSCSNSTFYVEQHRLVVVNNTRLCLSFGVRATSP